MLWFKHGQVTNLWTRAQSCFIIHNKFPKERRSFTHKRLNFVHVLVCQSLSMLGHQGLYFTDANFVMNLLSSKLEGLSVLLHYYSSSSLVVFQLHNSIVSVWVYHCVLYSSRDPHLRFSNKSFMLVHDLIAI